MNSRKDNIRSDREAHRLMRSYYGTPRPGAHYMPRAQRHMTRQDWINFGNQLLAIFNVCVWSYVAGAFLGVW